MALIKKIKPSIPAAEQSRRGRQTGEKPAPARAPGRAGYFIPISGKRRMKPGMKPGYGKK